MLCIHTLPAGALSGITTTMCALNERKQATSMRHCDNDFQRRFASRQSSLRTLDRPSRLSGCLGSRRKIANGRPSAVDVAPAPAACPIPRPRIAATRIWGTTWPSMVAAWFRSCLMDVGCGRGVHVGSKRELVDLLVIVKQASSRIVGNTGRIRSCYTAVWAVTKH
jgi:hypothetical protein